MIGTSQASPRLQGADFRQALIDRQNARDRAGHESPQVIAVVAQVQSTWGAVAPVVEALRMHNAAQVDVVAVESEHDIRDTSTHEFIIRQGLTPRDSVWLKGMIDDPASGLSTVIFYDPWDGLRPPEAGAVYAAERGVRVVYFPYSPNAAAGAKMEEMSYNLPTHQVAWRIYGRSETQRELFEKHCAVGSEQVRVLGTPKLDRIVSGSVDVPPQWGEATQGRRVVLWNPHFSFQAGGWSTFLDYLEPLVTFARNHPDVCLLIRPHFRIMRDLGLMGQAGQDVLRILAEAEELDNVVIDRTPDYLAAFAVADAMVSDLSSLLTEFFVTGKPLLYLHRADGPGINEDADYFLACDVALEWSDVRNFLVCVESGMDLGASRRALARARYFGHDNGGSSDRIATDILDSLRAEQRRVADMGATQRVTS